LSITEDDFIKIVVNVATSSAGFVVYRLFPNTAAGVSDFDTTTNYHHQRLTGDGSSTSASRSNINRFFANGNSVKGTVIG